MGAARPRRILAGLLLALAAGILTGWWFMIRMPGVRHEGALPELTAAERDLATRLRGHVEVLADEIGERHVHHPEALARAAGYVRDELEGLGYEVGRHPYRAAGVEVANLDAELPGRVRSLVVVGAHYDSVLGCPAANDNGSGVAALLELARALAGRQARHPVRLVAFVNEEPPFFQTSEQGSLVYARELKEAGHRVEAMLSLETLGYYSDEPGSQRYPFPLDLVYPTRGDFLAFVGDLSSRALVRRSIGSFRGHTRFPTEGAALPGWIPGVGWSDHWSFWQQGYPAIMLTDTAPFRFPHYHTRGDTPETLDYPRLARVVAGVVRLVEELAGIEPAPTSDDPSPGGDASDRS